MGVLRYMALRLARVPPALAGEEAMKKIQAAAPRLWLDSASLMEWLQEECDAKDLPLGPLTGVVDGG